eukprot:11186232-Lingulodinium_polyedra.AAC.1
MGVLQKHRVRVSMESDLLLLLAGTRQNADNNVSMFERSGPGGRELLKQGFNYDSVATVCMKRVGHFGPQLVV